MILARLFMKPIVYVGFLGCLVFFHAPAARAAQQSEQYQLNQTIINAGGTTRASATQRLFDSQSEPVAGQTFGRQYSVQAGFFNDYFMPPPTPTITCTPIRTFGGEVLNSAFVFAAPNPMRGNAGNLCFDLAMESEVTLKIYTTANNLVISEHWDVLPAGTNHWVWNTSGMANGVYLLWIKAKGVNGKISTVIKKIALVH